MDLNELEAKLAEIEVQTTDPSLLPADQVRLEKASSILKAAIDSHKAIQDIKKTTAETSNLLRGARSESSRYWISVAAPLVGSIAVVATLLFQIHQFNENSKLQRINSEGTAFRNLIQSTHMPSELSSYTNMALLKTFLKSEAYGEQARTVAVSMMSGIASRQGFREMFLSVFPDINYSDLPELVRLSRIQNETISVATSDKRRAEKDLEDAKKRGVETQPSPSSRVQARQIGTGGLTAPNYQDTVDQIQGELDEMGDNATMTSAGIATALRKRPEDAVPDLTAALIWSADLSGLKFGSAILTGTEIGNSDVSDADLGSITQFADSDWSYTQWWRAKKINSGLLVYLKQNFAFDSSVNYFGKAASQSEYQERIEKLSSSQ